MERPKASLIVTNKDGSKLSCKYSVKSSYSRVGEIIFRVFPDIYCGEQYYEVTVSTFDDNCVCVLVMNNHLPLEFHEKRIGAELLQEVARLLGKRVCSNSCYGQSAGERVSKEEYSCWQDLIGLGLAEYDKESDRCWLK